MKALFTFLILLIPFAAHPQADTTGFSNPLTPADSLQIDSAKVKEPIDTTYIVPMMEHGSSYMLNSVEDTLSKRDWQFKNYADFTDITDEFFPAYPIELGNYARFGGYSFYGGMPSGLTVMHNGINLADPFTGSFDLNYLSPEYIEKIEFLKGSEAVIIGHNSTGAALNIQEIRHDTKRPYTKGWFAEGGNGLLAIDAVYSHNFAKGWNLTLGARNLNSEGDYENSWSNAWNARILLRWSPDSLTTISLAENFYNVGNGSFSGLNADNIEYSPLDAEVNFLNLNERNFRHQLSLSLSKFLGSDSVNAFSGSAYYFTSRWDRNSGGDFYFSVGDSTEFISYISRSYGARGQYEFRLQDYFFIAAGGSVEFTSIPVTYFTAEKQYSSTAVYGRGILNLSEALELSGGIRLQSLYGNTGISTGSRVKYTFGNNSVFADLSFSERLPYPSENENPDPEGNALLLLGFTTDNSRKISFGGDIFLRSVQGLVISKPLADTSGQIVGLNTVNNGDYTFTGMNLRVHFPIVYGIEGEVYLNPIYSLRNNSEINILPKFNGKLKIFYSFKVARSILIAGASVSGFSSFTGYSVYPVNSMPYLQGYQTPANYNGADVFASAKLGSAYVKFAFFNLLNSGYHSTPVYPGLRRNFRLSVSWAFD